MIKHLPYEQVVALRNAFKKTKRKREALRYQALLLLTEEYTRKQTATIVHTSIHALGSWVTRYNKHGIHGLKDTAQKGNHHKLTIQQKHAIKDLITNKQPHEAGYEGRFWTTTLLQQLVYDRYHRRYQSPTSYVNLFKYCGFSFHKPDKINKKQNKQSIQAFEKRLKKDWRDIAQEMGWYW